ncbi:SDR family oxidoreductase [Oleiagrimonas sp.]|jgi:NAD(P)-dependent dehydrogenase (short-subunit alcohol dehydrogenase family)|uniref:SDR family NAD(P)-dependent oxidoreductase n=1 Tax=Oleiagrimonas sp. TaxID=2010330 RepID=UPI00261AA683|nr:SDR family oxidoreductase [Oleiagrimonas sp.]MDA3914055.1 SDR family NAD(P)-dependent oxidoreductase [Oleiagrimonas sp.]
MSQPTAIITGAGGAIAGYIIEAFAEAGWKLGLIAYSENESQRAKQTCADAAVAVANLANEDAARTAIGDLEKQLGHADALLNIAGGFDMSSATDTSMAQLEAQMDINLRTAFNATRAVLPGMLENGHGLILGVGAAAAIDGGASMGPYAASKAALITWLKSVHAEVAPQGVDVAILYPMAAVDTPGNRHAMPDVDPQTWIDPRELAASALHLATRGARGRMLEAKVYAPAN